tara:strand:- start:212 stop:532 length:321 start_codon:yes stop_codon:yes gene_type:complete
MVNDMGVDPHEWFDNPLDRMPIATEPKIAPLGGCYNYNKLKKEGLIENPDESDVIESEKSGLDEWFEDKSDEKITLHEELYQMAIKNNPLRPGGSENFQGGSENLI